MTTFSVRTIPIDAKLFTRADEFPSLETLPGNLYETLRLPKDDSLLMNTLRPMGTKIFFEFKEEEWNAFCAQVTDWEMQRYINI